MLMCSSVFAQHRLEKLWESDSLTLKGPESALYDAKSNSLYVSSMGSGSIVQMDLNGKILKSEWISGLNANKGSGIFNGLLYTAETAEVAVIDIAKSSIVKRIPIDGALMLNDVAIDSKGVVYVSDTRAGKVYKIEDDKPSLYLDNLPGANGLLIVNNDLYVLTSSSVQKVNAAKEISLIAEGFEDGLDGIVQVAENEFVISNYHGILYYLNANGTKQVLLDSRANRIMANDIGYNSRLKILYVPSFSTNRIIAYQLK